MRKTKQLSNFELEKFNHSRHTKQVQEFAEIRINHS